MAAEILELDENGHWGLGGVTNDATLELRNLRVDPTTNRLLVDAGTISVTADTEFPTAAAITDNFANPTTTSVMGMSMLWDGATWDRALGNSTDGALVNLGTNNDVTLNANSGIDVGDVTVNNASGASAVNVQDGGNSITVDGSVSITGAVDTELTTADLDTGAGTDTRAVVGLVLGASGGGLLVGSANPMPVSDNAGSLTVDGTVSLGAGAASIGILGANSGVDIGDTTINNASGAAAVNIQDGGNSITIDGTVAVTGVATETTLASLLTSSQLIDDTIYASDGVLNKTQGIGAVFDDVATVAITENQAGYLRMSSRRALLVEGVASGTAINVLDTNSATALTALQLIDNAVSGAGFNITQFAGAAVPIGAGLEATAVRVTLPTDGTGVVKLGTGVASIGILGANSGIDIGDTTINNASGASAVNIQDGGNSITVDGTVTANAGTGNFNTAQTSGGATPYKLVSAATTNATSVKASAGQVYMITASNVNAAVRYLKLYNKATAPTVGTDVPVHTFAIPGNTAGAGTNIPVPDCGLVFGTGIAFALTTEATDAGATAVAASEIVVNLAYA